MARHGIEPIDLLVVNLYPFVATVNRADSTFEEAIEHIDIGGPAMLRAAAKNHAFVTVAVDAADYPRILDALAEGGIPARLRRALATKCLEHTARYDGAIASYLGARTDDTAKPQAFAATINLQFRKVQDMRYGENPHQAAAFYSEQSPPPGTIASARQLQGKALSYNNIADTDAALQCARAFTEAPACVIVKHANPCGVAVAATPVEAYQRAVTTDPTSAFGGIIAFNHAIDDATARAILDRQFVEVV